MTYLGYRAAGSTVYVPFTTHDAAGATVAPSSAFEAADVRIYKNGSATQRASEAGYTMTSPFDSVVGLHMLAIDLSDDTDSGFYAAGSHYQVVLVPSDETVDGQTVARVLASFDIGVQAVNTTQIEGSDATDQINAACDAALADYDGPTHTELTTLIGTPDDTDIATDIANLLTALESRIGDPANGDIASDIGDVASAIAGLNDLSAAEVNAEVVDALNVDTYAEPGQGNPPATASIVAKLGFVHKYIRNKKEQTADTFSLYNDDGTTVGQKATVADDGTTASKGEMVTGA